MSTPEPQAITQLLQDARAGQSDASESLLALVYGELGDLARAQLSRERADHTLQPTALVHEAWLKLAGNVGHASDRRHFFALASRVMRRVLTDHARGRNRQKRGGAEGKPITLDESYAMSSAKQVDFVELDDVLSHLAKLNERHARVVELRIFGGLTIAEVAEELEVSTTTVENDWFTARAWLRTALDQSE